MRLVQTVCGGPVRPDEEVCQRRQVGQEVGDGAAGQGERRVGRVGIGEAARTEDVEANEHLDVRHRPEFAGLDAPQDLLRGMVEEVVVVFDEMAAGLLGAPDQRLQLVEGRGGRLLDDDVGASVERVQGEPEMGGRWRGDVDHVGPDLFQHGPMVGEPGPDAVPLGGSLGGGGREVANGRQLDARQRLQAGQVLPGDLPGSDERCLHERDLQDPAIEALQSAGPHRSRSTAPPPAASPTGRCCAAKLGFGQQAVHRVREGRGLVLDEEVAPGDGLDPLGAQRGRDDGFPHRHGLDDFEAGAAAEPQRHHHGCGRRQVRPQVRHEAGQLDPGSGQRQKRRRRPAANDLAACVAGAPRRCVARCPGRSGSRHRHWGRWRGARNRPRCGRRAAGPWGAAGSTQRPRRWE